MDQLSLVFFTVLAQAAAGMSLVLCALQLTGVRPQSGNLYLRGYVIVLPLLAIAAVASFSHLGQPLRAFNVINGLFHGSPLSWEILAVGVYGSAALLVAVLHGPQHHLLVKYPLVKQPLFSLLAAATGVLMVYAISRVYNLPTVQAWHSHWTPLQFITTMLLLGFCLVGCLLVMSDEDEPALIKTGAVLSLSLAMTQLPMLMQFVGQMEGYTGYQMGTVLPLVRMVFLATGAVFWLMPLLLGKRSVTTMAAAVVCLLISELSGRAFFYDLMQLRLL